MEKKTYTKSEALAMIKEIDGGKDCPIFLLTKPYCGIPAGAIVEACALRDSGLGLRIVEDLGFQSMAGYEAATEGSTGGWWVYLENLAPLTSVARALLAVAKAASK